MRSFILMYPVLTLLVAPAFAANDNVTYLALGDSVPFGLNAALLPPYSQQIPTPSQFIGYPEVVAATERVKAINASCPGESSGSFLDTSVLDYGCNSPHPYPPPIPPAPPFKTSIGLHTNYAGAQMAFAEAQFKANKHLNLVTLSIGANDVLLALPALAQCGLDQACAQAVLAPVLQTYAGNLAQILTRIRAQYRGTLILTTYYSPSPDLDDVTKAVNSTMRQVAAQLAAQPGFPPVSFADGFAAFQLISAPFGHDACRAGLLVRLPASPYTTTPCDIHPSALGRYVLGATVEVTLHTGH